MHQTERKIARPLSALCAVLSLALTTACGGDTDTLAPGGDERLLAAAQGTRVIEVAPSTNPVSFGTVQSPFESATPTTQIFTVTNVGSKVTSGLALSITGTGAAAYSIKPGDDGCTGRSLQLSGKNKSCTVKVTFAPAAAGTFTAALTVTVAQPKATVTVNLSGSGAYATSITIRSAVTGSDVSVNFTAAGGLTPASFALANGASRTFSGAAPGPYSVTETTPTGYRLVNLTCTASGAGTSVNTNVLQATITLASGGSVDCVYTTAEFIAVLSGTVFDDTDLTGAKGAGETGHAGVTVNLKDGSGITTLQTTTTGNDGSYSFNAATGSYKIEVVAPAGTAITTQNAGPRTVDVTSADVLGLDVGVNTFNIRVKISSCSTGLPREGSSVTLSGDTRLTDADGLATWLRPEGQYNLRTSWAISVFTLLINWVPGSVTVMDVVGCE
jgi:hypothetical protein